jgi:hypothetical protein
LRKEMADYRVLRFMHRYGAKDGKLTLAQFTQHRNERFAKRDADNDGMIGRGEGRGHHGWGGGRRWHRDGGQGAGNQGEGAADDRAPAKPDNQ